MMGTRNWLSGREQKTPSTRQTASSLVLTVTFAVVVLTALVPMRASAAVTISSFTAKALAPQIQVNWTTATEINNAGFNLLRSASASGTFSQVNTSMIPAKNPGSILGASYSYTDGAVTPGQTYYYKLVSIENGGGKQQFGPVSSALPAPATATAISVPPTATWTLSPTPLPTATNTPIPSAMSTSIPVPSSAPAAALVTAPSPTSTSIPVPTSASPAALVAAPSLTRDAKIVRPRASSTPNAEIAMDNPELPTPGVTLVALGIKQATAEPDVDSSQTETNSPAETGSSTRAYYFFRLIDATLLLTAGTLVFGSFVLGALSVYFFLRAYLR